MQNRTYYSYTHAQSRNYNNLSSPSSDGLVIRLTHADNLIKVDTHTNALRLMNGESESRSSIRQLHSLLLIIHISLVKLNGDYYNVTVSML
jgi:hypothetical protein